MLNSPKTNTFADELIRRILSMLKEIVPKNVQKDEEGD